MLVYELSGCGLESCCCHLTQLFDIFCKNFFFIVSKFPDIVLLFTFTSKAYSTWDYHFWLGIACCVSQLIRLHDSLIINISGWNHWYLYLTIVIFLSFFFIYCHILSNLVGVHLVMTCFFQYIYIRHFFRTQFSDIPQILTIELLIIIAIIIAAIVIITIIITIFVIFI